MPITNKLRYYWTSTTPAGGPRSPSVGMIIALPMTPSDAYFLPDVPDAMMDADYQQRWFWDDINKAWTIYPDALPTSRPDDFYSWNWQERYVVNSDDPARDSWVLKPDAEPVEQPET